MKERWIAELAAVAALGVCAFVMWRILRQTPDGPEIVKPDISAEPIRNDALERAKLWRAEAIKSCDEGAFERCLKGLDEAKELDPAGDTAQDVVWARKKANLVNEPPPVPEPTSSTPTKTQELKIDQQKKPAPKPTSTAPTPKTRFKPSPKENVKKPTFEETNIFQQKGTVQKK
jgi:hypothetical protein